MANDTRYGLQAAIFTSDLATAMRAFSTLDFGGVLVNEVPTWRADQQPYGGVRDSGNTREGPAYSIREMTEIRMVILVSLTARRHLVTVVLDIGVSSHLRGSMTTGHGRSDVTTSKSGE